MRIGEFAKICHTKISVLRHYDKQGLLVPAYVDRFTGYRYYTKEQIAVFTHITALKKAGFSLAEIRRIISERNNTNGIIQLLEKKKNELQTTIFNLEEARKMLIQESSIIHTDFLHTFDGIKAKSSKVDGNDFLKACETLEEYILSQNYQRISNYMSYGSPQDNEVEAVCDVVKLRHEFLPLHENIDLPFVNDESIVGRWQTVGEYAVKEDFYADKFCDNQFYGEAIKEIYFLPKGERYWCYGWTKGKLLFEDGDCSSVNDYETEIYAGQRYMFIYHKSYYYRRGGKPTVLVLRQTDNRAYTAKEIARKDNIDLPFVHDERVLGRWNAHSYCQTKESFSPDTPSDKPLYFRSIEFLKNGRCISQYGEEIISSEDMQVWTKGYVLRKWNESACGYEIRTIDHVDYLILEWKSGDYRWGGFDTDYYVFTREL